MKFTLGKNKKLKSRKIIAQLFLEGQSIKEFPLKAIFLPIPKTEEQITKVAFSVPKRNFKLAVHRNKIKRLLREAYRLHQYEWTKEHEQSYYIMFIYMHSKIPDYKLIAFTLKKIIKTFKSL